MMPFILTAIGFFAVIITLGLIDRKLTESNEEKKDKEMRKKYEDSIYDYMHGDEDSQYKQNERRR